MIPTWRLLTTPPARGAWNMAVDEAILEATGRGAVLPTLRLYAWEPPCLSLGYAQPYRDVDLARLRARGWDIVRRATGGRAILHTDELTYSIAGPADDPLLAGSVLESYNRIALALQAAVRALGMQVELKHPVPGLNTNDGGPVCFEVPSAYEITVGGKKLIGSAQARRREGVLQHGTLPLGGDLTRITQVLVFTDEVERARAASRLLEHATTAGTVLGIAPGWQKAADALVEAFASTLKFGNLKGWQTSGLTEAELARTQELLREKYANPVWTERV